MIKLIREIILAGFKTETVNKIEEANTFVKIYLKDKSVKIFIKEKLLWKKLN